MACIPGSLPAVRPCTAWACCSPANVAATAAAAPSRRPRLDAAAELPSCSVWPPWPLDSVACGGLTACAWCLLGAALAQHCADTRGLAPPQKGGGLCSAGPACVAAMCVCIGRTDGSIVGAAQACGRRMTA